METKPFIISLVLVLIGQIPLIVKLWLDYNSRRAVYRDQLFEKQIGAYIEICQLLSNLHHSCHGHVFFFGLDEADESRKELIVDIRGQTVKNWTALREAVKKHEFILPSRAIALLSKYETTCTHIISAGMKGFPTSTREELEKLWEEQTVTFNDLVNYMRFSVGIDRLSEEVTAMVFKKGDNPVIARKFDPRL